MRPAACLISMLPKALRWEQWLAWAHGSMNTHRQGERRALELLADLLLVLATALSPNYHSDLLQESFFPITRHTIIPFPFMAKWVFKYRFSKTANISENRTKIYSFTVISKIKKRTTNSPLPPRSTR